MKKYRALKPWIAFGKCPQPGEIVWLTDDQADALRAEGGVEPYEVKVEPPVKKPEQAVEQKVEPPSASQPAPVSRKRTFRSRLKKLIS